MKSRIVIPFLLASMLIAGCKTQQQASVKIGYAALRSSVPVYLAQEKGIFKKYGLTVELQRFETAQPLMESLVAGNLDAGGYTAMPIIESAMIRSKTSLYFTTTMLEDRAHRISYLIVPKNAPADMKITDLKGKKIGILPTVAYKVYIEQILKANGMQPTDVEIVQVNPALQPTALQSKQVDALFTNDPAATAVMQKGIGRKLTDEAELPKIFGSPFLFATFNIRKDFADKNPDTADRLVKALDEAVTFVNTNQGEARKIMKEFLPEAQTPFVDYYTDVLYQPSAKTDADMFQRDADKNKEIGAITDHLDISDLVLKAK